jgi:hypothetical protein
VPLFPGDPGNKPRLLPKVRLSAFRLPLFSLGGSLNPPITRRHLRAAMTLAQSMEPGEMHERMLHAQPSYAGLTRVSIALRKMLYQSGWIAGSSPAMTMTMDCRVKPGNGNFGYPRFHTA